MFLIISSFWVTFQLVLVSDGNEIYEISRLGLYQLSFVVVIYDLCLSAKECALPVVAFFYFLCCS